MSRPMKGEEKLLDYHDVLLYKSDAELLTGPHWLNDQVIAFYFEYLQRDVHAGHGISFCGPSFTFFLAHGDGAEVEAMLAPLQLERSSLVLFAVNDNSDVARANGGSHWSLLVYSRDDGTFRHYNSSAGSNKRAARALAQKAADLLGVGAAHTYTVAQAPQQRNSYDCGLYVLGMAGAIAEKRRAGCTWAQVDHDIITELMPAAVHAMRTELLELIMRLSSSA